MNLRELGERILLARELSGSSQATLADKVGLDRSAISRIEQGERKTSVTELLTIAEALGRPLSFFVAPAEPSVTSRRTNPNDTHESNLLLDEELRAFAADVRSLLDRHVVSGVNRTEIQIGSCTDHGETEHAAGQVRSRVGISPDEPILDLGRFCERLGLVTYAAALMHDGPDGACVEVGEPGNELGVAVVNGQAPPGRRRMTLAHELGHWLTGDAYDREAGPDTERMIDSFAIHLLGPRAGVTKVWNAHPERTVRDRVITICSEFRLSWTAGLGQARNVGLISRSQFVRLQSSKPNAGEFARLGLRAPDEPIAPYLSPELTAQILDAFVDHRLTAERTVELLRGTLSADELPPPAEATLHDLRASFVGNPA